MWTGIGLLVVCAFRGRCLGVAPVKARGSERLGSAACGSERAVGDGVEAGVFDVFEHAGEFGALLGVGVFLGGAGEVIQRDVVDGATEEGNGGDAVSLVDFFEGFRVGAI